MHSNNSRLSVLGYSVMLSLVSVPAFAHLGHLGEFAGHSHVAGAVLGGLAIGLTGILAAQSRRAKDRDMKTADENTSDDQGEQPEIADGNEQNA
ncbi:MAG: DUF6732 family protein [Candidatus Puniceispirillum sp.]